MCGFGIIYAGSASPMLSNQHVSNGNRLVKDLTGSKLKSLETGMYELIPYICVFKSWLLSFYSICTKSLSIEVCIIYRGHLRILCLSASYSCHVRSCFIYDVVSLYFEFLFITVNHVSFG